MPRGGKRQARRQVLADLLWEALVRGQVTFDEDETLPLKASDWIGLIKLVFAQTADAPGDDAQPEPAAVRIVYQEVESRRAEAGAAETEADDGAAD